MDGTLIDGLVELLSGVGFSIYEAKAYAALLGEKQPVTRYALAKISGVPSPKIYDAVQRLYEKGYVTQTVDEIPLVSPVDPEVLLDQLRREQETSLDRLYELLQSAQLTGREGVGYIWSLAGLESAFAKAMEIIQRSHSSIYMAGFGQDLTPLVPEIKAAEKRGVKVRVLSYGHSLVTAGEIAEHGDVEGIVERTGGRWLALVSDRDEILVSYPLDGNCESVWTNSPVLSLMISKYVDEHFYQDRPISIESQNEVQNGQENP